MEFQKIRYSCFFWRAELCLVYNPNIFVFFYSIYFCFCPLSLFFVLFLVFCQSKRVLWWYILTVKLIFAFKHWQRIWFLVSFRNFSFFQVFIQTCLMLFLKLVLLYSWFYSLVLVVYENMCTILLCLVNTSSIELNQIYIINYLRCKSILVAGSSNDGRSKRNIYAVIFSLIETLKNPAWVHMWRTNQKFL